MAHPRPSKSSGPGPDLRPEPGWPGPLDGGPGSLPVVAVHGMTSSHTTWGGLVLATKPFGIRVHSLSLLGHGPVGQRRGRGSGYPVDAFVDDVIDQMDEAGVDRCVLVGHSLGAFVSSLVVQRQPERFARVLLEEMPVPAPSRSVRAPIHLHTALGMGLGAWFVRDQVDPALVGAVMRQLVRPRPDWWQGCAELGMPVLLVAGGRRSYLDQRRYPELVRTIPDARLATFEVGHRVHVDAGKPYLDVAVPFLTGVHRPADGWNDQLI